MIRCSWAQTKYLKDYHDNEWGKPEKNSVKLFENLCLEGQQAGLSWEIILKKREDYRKAYDNFNPIKIAKMSDEEIDYIIQNYAVIKYKLKQQAIKVNAIAFLNLEKTISFSQYIWSYTNHTVLDLKSDPNIKLKIAQKLSKDLKKHGFKFIGPTICYSFLEASGLFNGHACDCFFNNSKIMV